MLDCVAGGAQRYNVVEVFGFIWVCAFMKNVVSLQLLCRAAFNASAVALDRLLDRFSFCVGSMAGPTPPVWMVFFSHTRAAPSSRARDGAKLARTTTSKADLKRGTALLARTVQQSFWLSTFDFLCACNRTRNVFAPDVRVCALNFGSAGSAFKRGSSCGGCKTGVGHGK